MKKTRLLMLLLCVLWGSVWAQNNLPYPADITGYRGNTVVSDSLPLQVSDTLKVITAVARRSINLDAPLTVPQPIVVRKKLKAVVVFETSDGLPQQFYYRLFVGGQARYAGQVSIGQYMVSVSKSEGLLLSGLNSTISSLQAQLNALKNTSVDAGAYTTAITSLSTAIGGKVPQDQYNIYKQAIALQNANRDALIGTKVDSVALNSYKTAQDILNSNQNTQIAAKLNVSDTSVFVRDRTGYDLYPDADRNKLAGIASGATSVTNTNQLTNGAGFLNTITGVTSASYAQDQLTRAATDQAQNDAIGLKANSADVYLKAQTYTQTEANALVAPKLDSTLANSRRLADLALTRSKIDSSKYNQNRAIDLLKLDAKPAYVTDIASLTALDRGNVTSFIVQGPRGGQFEYKPASTSLVVDNGVVFRAKDGGYIVRQYKGRLQLSWYDLALPAASLLASALLVSDDVELPSSVTLTLSSQVNVSSGKTLRNGHFRADNAFAGASLLALGNGAVLESVELDGNALNQTQNISGVNVLGATDVRIINCTIHDFTLKGIYMQNGGNSNFSGGSIYNIFTKQNGSGTTFEAAGVCIEGIGSDCRSVNNIQIHDIGLIGIDFRNRANNCEASDNKISRIGQSGRDAIGIQSYYYSLNSAIVGNTIQLASYNNALNQWPISLDKANNSLAANNRITVASDQTQYGIEVVASQGVLLATNTIFHSATTVATTYAGIVLNRSSRCLAIGNTISSAAKLGMGIWVRGFGQDGALSADLSDDSKTSSLGSWENSIRNNTIYDVNIGVFLDQYSRRTEIGGGSNQAVSQAIYIISGEGQIVGGNYKTTTTQGRGQGVSTIYFQYTNVNYPVSGWLVQGASVNAANTNFGFQGEVSRVRILGNTVSGPVFADNNATTQSEVYIEGNDLTACTNISNYGTVSTYRFGANLGLNGGFVGVGTTANRPSLVATNRGAYYFDTSLGRAVFWSGSVWSDPYGNLAAVASTGNYNDLLNKPTIATNTNQLTNGAGFITSAVSGTTNVGANLFALTQQGTGRALNIQRSVDNAARPAVSIVQNSNSNAQPNLLLHQQDPTQKALVVNNDGATTNTLFYVDGTGKMGHVYSSGAVEPTTSTLLSGQCVLWKNTSAGTIKWYCNDGGTIKSGAAFN